MSPAILTALYVVALAPASGAASEDGFPHLRTSTTTSVATADEADPLAAPLSPLAAWGCHGPAAVGILLGATIGGLGAGIAGAWGTYTVNASVDEEQRTSLTAMSFLLSSALGVLIGGGIGAGVGLIVEALVPDAPVRRVIRVTDRGQDTSEGGTARAAIAF